jgi:hypothetical protein
MREETDICDFPGDPLLSKLPFPHRAVFYPMGFPLEVETNSPDVLDALRKSWQMFPQQFIEEPLQMSVGVSQGDWSKLSQAPLLRSRSHLMSIVSDAGNFLSCDLSRGFIFGWVTEQLVEEESFFRYHFLDVSVLTAIQQLHLAPVHAGLVARNGQGVALCGNSSSGKSTMAYACARAGWTFVADDATFLLRKRADRYAIGNPHTIRFRESARRLFPELSHYACGTRPNGKLGIEAFTSNLPIATSPGCSIEHVVFLNRNGSSVAQLRRCQQVRAIDWCSRFAEWGDDGARSHQAEAYRRLAGCSVWEMEYRDLDSGVARLEQLTQACG